MKKIVAFILLTCMALTLVACTDNKSNSPETTTPQDTTSNDTAPEISLQEIYDACKTEALLKNHESVYISSMTDGEIWCETYITQDYAYEYVPDEKFSYAKFMTDDACYYNDAGTRLLYLFVTPDGLGNFASKRAEDYAAVLLGEETLDDIIESVSKKDGRITVTGVLGSKTLEFWAEDGVTSGKYDYVLDADTREMISISSDYSYNDGSSFNSAAELTYDTEAPEMLREFLGYVNQTENLRNVTVVSNPGAEKEESKSLQAPKGLIIGFEYDEDLGCEAEFYTDAACAEAYDPYANTDSDLTVYVKWNTKIA